MDPNSLEVSVTLYDQEGIRRQNDGGYFIGLTDKSIATRENLRYSLLKIKEGVADNMINIPQSTLYEGMKLEAIAELKGMFTLPFKSLKNSYSELR